MPRFSKRGDVLQRVVGDEVLVATVHSAEVSSLSGSAARQWLMLDRPRTLEALVNGLADLYGVSAGAIRSDVGALLEELIRRGLVAEVVDDD